MKNKNKNKEKDRKNQFFLGIAGCAILLGSLSSIITLALVVSALF